MRQGLILDNIQINPTKKFQIKIVLLLISLLILKLFTFIKCFFFFGGISMNHIYKLFALLVAVMLVSACTENNTNVTAEFMTIDGLAKTPGYTWIPLELAKYEPKDSIITEIKENYNPESHSFIVFAKPSCSCPGKHLQTPAFLKTLEVAGIPLDKCEIYSVSSTNNKHPYQDRITLTELPTILVKSRGSFFSVSETINNINATNPNASITVEEALLLGLSD
jgi:hypothetical protein